MRLRKIPLFFVLVLITFSVIDKTGLVFVEAKPSEDTSKSPKIDSIIVKWQLDPDPEGFAQANNLSYSDAKIAVYVYLDSADSVSKIPAEIEVRSSDRNIIVARVTSQQIDELAAMDFVQRIATPDLANVQPPPNETPSEQTTSNETPSNDHALILAISAAVIAIGITAILKYKKKSSSVNKKI